MLATEESMEFAQGHALLIGIGSYTHAPELHVPSTAAEARALAAVLGDLRHCGYPASQIAALCDTDATREHILSSLRALAARAAADHTAVLFYSGHGHYAEDGEYCLTTCDTRLTAQRAVVAASAIRQSELLEALKQLRARRVLLIFNACHAGELSPTLGATPPSGHSLPTATSGALLATGEGRVIITACREHQYSFVGGGPHTLFGQALIDGLRGAAAGGADGTISVFDLYTHLHDAVGTAVQRDIPEMLRQSYGAVQEPELTILKGVGPFPVALYEGGASLGQSGPRQRPPAHTLPRELESTESEALLRQLQRGGVQVQPGASAGAISQNEDVSYNFSLQVGTSSGVLVGVNNNTITYSVVNGASQGEPADPIEHALAEIRRHVQRSQHDEDLAADLERVALDLQDAAKARREGKAERLAAKLRSARRAFDLLSSEHEALADTAQLLGALST
jgi:hypothetical protein